MLDGVTLFGIAVIIVILGIGLYTFLDKKKFLNDLINEMREFKDDQNKNIPKLKSIIEQFPEKECILINDKISQIYNQLEKWWKAYEEEIQAYKKINFLYQEQQEDINNLKMNLLKKDQMIETLNKHNSKNRHTFDKIEEDQKKYELEIKNLEAKVSYLEKQLKEKSLELENWKHKHQSIKSKISNIWSLVQNGNLNSVNMSISSKISGTKAQNISDVTNELPKIVSENETNINESQLDMGLTQCKSEDTVSVSQTYNSAEHDVQKESNSSKNEIKNNNEIKPNDKNQFPIDLEEWLKKRNIQITHKERRKPLDASIERYARIIGERFETIAPFYNALKRRVASCPYPKKISVKNFPANQINDIIHLGSDLHKNGFLKNFKYIKSEDIIVFDPQENGEITNFLTGKWLERYVLYKVLEYLHHNKIPFNFIINPQIILPNSEDFELDILISTPSVVLWIECKTGNDYTEYISRYGEIAKKYMYISQKHSALVLLSDLTQEQKRNNTYLANMEVINFTDINPFLDVAFEHDDEIWIPKVNNTYKKESELKNIEIFKENSDNDYKLTEIQYILFWAIRINQIISKNCVSMSLIGSTVRKLNPDFSLDKYNYSKNKGWKPVINDAVKDHLIKIDRNEEQNQIYIVITKKFESYAKDLKVPENFYKICYTKLFNYLQLAYNLDKIYEFLEKAQEILDISSKEHEIITFKVLYALAIKKYYKSFTKLNRILNILLMSKSIKDRDGNPIEDMENDASISFIEPKETTIRNCINLVFDIIQDRWIGKIHLDSLKEFMVQEIESEKILEIVDDCFKKFEIILSEDHKEAKEIETVSS